MELSYSFHLGNDSNKTIKARREAKNTLSGTTNKSNNAIQNVRQLGKVNHHNLRLYDNKQELIKISINNDFFILFLPSFLLLYHTSFSFDKVFLMKMLSKVDNSFKFLL